MSKKSAAKAGTPAANVSVPSREAVARASHRRLTPSIAAPQVKPVRQWRDPAATAPSAAEQSKRTRRVLYPNLGKPVAPGRDFVKTV